MRDLQLEIAEAARPLGQRGEVRRDQDLGVGDRRDLVLDLAAAPLGVLERAAALERARAVSADSVLEKGADAIVRLPLQPRLGKGSV